MLRSDPACFPSGDLMSSPIPRRFSIALSFPGEYRNTIEEVATCLSRAHSKEKILYDKYHEAEFARIDLDIYLPNLYRTESELVVIFLCKNYIEKRWCNLEWRYIKQLIATPEQHRIMLLAIDAPADMTELGILPGDGCVDISTKQPFEIANLILQRFSIVDPSYASAPTSSLNVDHQILGKNKESTSDLGQESRCHGKQRAELLRFFVTDWLPGGPAVAMLQGFPGCGKTQLASEIAVRAARSLDPVEPQLGANDPSLDLLTDLALALDYDGIHDLMMEIEKGAQGNVFDVFLRVLTRERILVIIDEFQRLLGEKDNLPPKEWQDLIERLNNSHRAAGRLLIISNRSIKNARWCEKAVSKEVKGLSGKEAAGFLHAYLASKELSNKVPEERLEEIGVRLGGNPRALKTFVESLKYYSLDELISLAPDLFKPGDVTLNRDLVEDFERELIQRTLSNIDDELLQLMRKLSVYRRSFKKDAYFELAANTSLSSETLRKKLIDRFLLENTAGGDSVHPLAREISVTRLRDEKEEWRLAHGFAADYYFRYFRSISLQTPRKLTSSYAELRHHLFEAGRIKELYLASVKLSKFALSQITKPQQSKIPDSVETLEERIALISALPDEFRPKGLEYHLALCLKHRNTGADYQQALFHVRRAVGRHAYYAVWLLLIDLEYALNGIDAMIKAQNQAIKHLGSGSNAFAIYHHCANILDRDNRSNDAIKLLEKAINTPGVACVSSLISLCAKYLEKAGKFNDAIAILKKGIDTPRLQEADIVYMNCAKLMVKNGRSDDAIALLKKGIDSRTIAKPNALYLLLAELLVKYEKAEEAISLLKQGISDKRIRYPQKLYCYCAEFLVKEQRIEEAVSLLEVGMVSRVIKDPLPLYHALAEVMEEAGKPLDGVKLLMPALSAARLKTESSMYLACAKLLFRAREIDQAIAVLKRGLEVPEIREKALLIQMCAELIARKGDLDEAIELLEKGISESDTFFVYPLYHTCSELMVKAGRLEDAISLNKKGISAPGLTNKAVLYQTCAKLLDKAKRPEEAIDLLKKALSLPGMTGQVILYQVLAKLLDNVDRTREAIQILKKAITGPKMGNSVSLYYVCAEMLLSIGAHDDAIQLLKKGMDAYPKDSHLRDIYKKATEH
jgi:tetratricopeptide (TPR) repeat protein